MDAEIAGQAIGMLVNQAAEVKRESLPADCGKREKSGVLHGDPLHVALDKTDIALLAANNRVSRCYRLDQELSRKSAKK